TVVTAGLFAVMFTFPERLACLVLVLATGLSIPAMVCGAYYGREYGRSFCLGSLTWLFVTMWFWDAESVRRFVIDSFNIYTSLTPVVALFDNLKNQDFAFVKELLLANAFLIGLSGLMGVAARRLSQPPVGDSETEVFAVGRQVFPTWLLLIMLAMLVIAALIATTSLLRWFEPTLAQ
ncbi:MAG: hypothetical protein N2C14_08470, partial [Planctomycetales bacterium]